MSVVVDADSHLQPPLQWLQRTYPDFFPAREASAFSPVKMFVPPEFWPENEAEMYARPWYDFLLAQRTAIAEGVELDAMIADPSVDLGAIHRLFRSPGGFDGPERVKVLDAVGIDFQLVSGFSFGNAGLEGEAGQALISAANSLVCDTLDPHTDRLVPITDIDLADLDWSIAEMERVRARGSRLFNLPVQPVKGMSLSHSHFDRLWAAASDLGMLGYLHTFADPYDPAWCNNGGDYLQLSMISSVRYHHSAELLATVLIGGGVFARFPRFGVVMAEVGGLAWVPSTLGWLDAVAGDRTMHAMEGVQDWRYDLKPSEYAQRQLRVSPLPIEAQRPSPWLDVLGDIAVFSTDFPHPEGTPDPAIQGPEAAPDFVRADLAGVSPGQRDRYQGDSLADLFARSGDGLGHPAG